MRLVTYLLLLLSFSALAAPEDETFIINITGPNGTVIDDYLPNPNGQNNVTNRTTTNRATTPARTNRAIANNRTNVRTNNTAATTTANPNNTTTTNNVTNEDNSFSTYQVLANDNIWSVAKKLMPANGSVNEFQIIAALYRNNPDAFNNGNVNSLKRVKLKVPAIAQIKRELTKTGSDLLNKGKITLPALADIKPQMEPTNVAPTFVARETMLKELADKKESEANNNLYADDDGSVQDTDGKTVNKDNDPSKNAIMTKHARDLQNVDAAITETQLNLKSINEIVDNLKKEIGDVKGQLEKKVDNSILRTELIAKEAATNTTKTEVNNALENYESAIADLQQSNAELRAALSKLNMQIDQVRASSLDNADKLAEIQQSLLDVDTEQTEVSQGPLLWILLGVGILCFVLALTFFIFKQKARKAQKKQESEYDEEEDFDNNDELIKTSVNIDEKEQDTENSTDDTLDEKKEEDSTDSADNVESSNSLDVSDDDKSESEQANDTNTEGNQEEENKKSEPIYHPIDDKEEVKDNNAQELTDDEKATLEAWEKAAQEETQKTENPEGEKEEEKKTPIDDRSNDEKNAMAMWEEALKEQQNNQSVELDVDSNKEKTNINIDEINNEQDKQKQAQDIISEEDNLNTTEPKGTQEISDSNETIDESIANSSMAENTQNDAIVDEAQSHESHEANIADDIIDTHVDSSEATNADTNINTSIDTNDINVDTSINTNADTNVDLHEIESDNQDKVDNISEAEKDLSKKFASFKDENASDKGNESQEAQIIGNMLSDGNDSNKSTALSEDDIESMIAPNSSSLKQNETKIVDPIDSKIDELIEDHNQSYDEGYKDLNEDEQDTHNTKDNDNKAHQRYTDELNLALLFFETGDTFEALNILKDIMENGSPDLVQKAKELYEKHTNK